MSHYQPGTVFDIKFQMSGFHVQVSNRISLIHVCSEQGQITASSEVGHRDSAPSARDVSWQEAPHLWDGFFMIIHKALSVLRLFRATFIPRKKTLTAPVTPPHSWWDQRLVIHKSVSGAWWAWLDSVLGDHSRQAWLRQVFVHNKFLRQFWLYKGLPDKLI